MNHLTDDLKHVKFRETIRAATTIVALYNPQSTNQSQWEATVKMALILLERTFAEATPYCGS